MVCFGCRSKDVEVWQKDLPTESDMLMRGGSTEQEWIELWAFSRATLIIIAVAIVMISSKE